MNSVNQKARRLPMNGYNLKKIIAVKLECVVDIVENSETAQENSRNLVSNGRCFMLKNKNDIMFLFLITVILPSIIYLMPTTFFLFIPVQKPPPGSSTDSCEAFGYPGTPATSLDDCKEDPICSKTHAILKKYHAAVQRSGFDDRYPPSSLGHNISVQIVPSSRSVPFLSTGPQYDEFVSLQILRDIEKSFNSRIKAIQTHFHDMPIAGLSFKVHNRVLLDEIQVYDRFIFNKTVVKASIYKPNTFLMPIGYFNPEHMNEHTAGFYKGTYLTHTDRDINETARGRSLTHETMFPVGYVVLKSVSKANFKESFNRLILHEICHAWLNHGYPYSDRDEHYRKSGYYQEGILSKLLDPTLSKQERVPYAHAYKAICLSNVMLYENYCIDIRFLDMLTSPSLFLREYRSGTSGRRDTIPQHTIPHILVHHLNNTNKTSYLEKLAQCDILHHYKESIDWLVYGFYGVSAALYYNLISTECNEIVELDSETLFADWNKDIIASIGNNAAEHDYETDHDYVFEIVV